MLSVHKLVGARGRRRHERAHEYGAAMLAFLEAHASGARVLVDGIESEAFHRGGDNPTSLRVWSEGERAGFWADPRDPDPPDGFTASTFATHVAGFRSLTAFMCTWGSEMIAAAPGGRSAIGRPHPRATPDRGTDAPSARDGASGADLWRLFYACVPVLDSGQAAARGLVVEGAPRFLSWASRWPDDVAAPGVRISGQAAPRWAA